ncbi:MAG: GTP 3',8-cyclase MoaA [gamma proteobacterium symbiont of Ctena orbiculata]|uniref:GTP 3',8-cyclase n=1 Tax=Candidatus Thiodiazotropha taylori TaxID=2792791 RepID=A0A944QTY9_9GAMM|nr:GTP 3',8-cyclase MoaA [Candidatus Thiodiazotropha taylori]PUB82441.1 MAG: GTP 3',8-cyclase MoaA [gamma proteobacterium symbiont of Ctena orbiculata]MBT3027803.1 GTP 3',8-cyclase MoaA [Candidatus Thiodiazotropha taylori]MBT3035415.1 GTP 3',8-cyclase MoaA [Candidatus Thiodiazotropha taylori]MBV2136917.1 GTP 3',8-cyclase MoaA [Candidatus Thiodiazotropha taylori]
MLNDPFGRRIEYLRLSVTDRCDFRCFYCLPRSHRDFEMPDDWLTTDEIERLVAQFAALGVKHVRLTGGEPLVRKGVDEIARRIAKLPGIEELSLSTNASRLSQFAEQLSRAGVSRLNISLDSLNDEKFHDITGSRLQPVLAGIARAQASGMSPIKINMVVMRGINDDEVESMIEYCLEHHLTLRFIETMPVGQGGQAASEHYMPLAEIEERLKKRYRLGVAAMRGSGPARYFRVDDSNLVIGFITPQSQHFCDTCNRVRVSVSGDLHLCLGQEEKLELRPLLRSGATDETIQQAIRGAIARKPQRHNFHEAPTAIIRPMSALGG